MLYENKLDSYLISFVNSSFDYPAHVHTYLETIHVAEGQLEMQIGTEKYILGKNDFAIVFPNVIHTYHTLTDDSHTSLDIGNIIVSMLSISKLNFEKNIPSTPIIHSLEAPKQLYWIQDQLNSLSDTKNQNFLIGGLFSLLIAYSLPLLHLRPIDESINKDEAFRIIAYVAEHCTDRLSLDSISKNFGISRFSVSRIFSSMLGTSFPKYLNQQRINYAKYQLLNTECDIMNIAYNCGYSSQQTFNRVFKDIVGITPSEFRINNIGIVYPENLMVLLPKVVNDSN